jgi:hypothetical protein
MVHEPRPVDPIDTPLEVRLIEGEVVVIGPGPVAFSMTPAAARETCRRLGDVLLEAGDPA